MSATTAEPLPAEMAQEAAYPLSPQQRRAARLAAAGQPWRAAAMLALEGGLDVEALARALTRVVERNEILRTRLHRPAGMALPLQVIAEPVRLSLPLADLGALPEDRRDGAAGREAERALRGEGLPFLPGAAALGAVLLRLSAGRHRLLLMLGAGAADRAALADLLREVAACYGAERGEAPPPEDRLQYVDFATWQLDLLAGEDSAPGREHWRGIDLAGAAALGLSFESEPPPGTPFALRTLVHPLPAGLAGSLAERFGALEPAVLAAWGAVLATLCDLPEVTVGVGFDGRRLEELANAQGLFARFLPVRVAIPSERPFAEAVEKLSEELARAGDWQEAFSWDEPLALPFVFEVRQEGLRQGAGGVTFALLAEQLVPEPFTARLTLMRGVPGALEIAWDCRRLTADDARRLCGSVEAVLAAAVAAGEAPAGELPVVGAEERAWLAETLHRAAPPEAEPFLGLFARRAAEDSAHPAVVQGTETLSFGELEAAANRLARHLRERGMGPGRVVGLHLDRSPQMVVALLAVLKAGGAYLPLDPTWPRERLAAQLEDAGAALLVTTSDRQDELGSGPRVLLDTEREAIARAAADPLPDESDPDELAYVLYTSGSTGRPKGVAVSRRNLAASTAARFAFYRRPVGVYLLASSFAFDSSVAGIFWTLAAGGTLALPLGAFQQDLPAFVDFLEQTGATHLLCLPSLYNLVLDEAPSATSGRLPALSTVIVAGEACPAALVERHFSACPDRDLFNEYGPTEGTVWCSVYDTAELAPGARTVPIGGAIPGATLHAVNPAGMLVPTGAPGELLVGGAGVARGYLGRPGETAERFLPDPFSGLPGARLYRTGDRVRRRPDGALDFLGRADHQVKIRGHRIEPAEVEAALAAHPGVREAAVVALASPRSPREGERSDLRLVAYAVPRGEALAPAELRAFLAERLPEPMIPAAFVFLAALPLTPNGKVDRRSLPDPGAPGGPAARHVPPATPEEKVLAEVWGEVLGLPRVSVEDSFFELGGDSILSVQVRARALARGFKLTVQQLFEYRTVRALAPRMARMGEEGGGSGTAPFALVAEEDRRLLPEGLEDAYPLTLLQAGLVYESERRPESGVFYDISTYHLSATLDLDALRRALDGLAEAHPILRTSFALAGYGAPLQLVHRQAEIPVSHEDLSHLLADGQERAVAAYVESEKRRRFDWGQAPLLRVHVHTRAPGRFQLTVTEHHAILDGWSYASFLTELMRRYLALLEADDAAGFPPPAARFADAVALELRALAEPDDRAFWHRFLEGARPAALPWLPLASQEGEPSHEILVRFSDEETAGLRRLAAAAGAPLKSVVVAAHAFTLAEITGEDGGITGLMMHGRPESADGERILGLFLNLVPFRLPVGGATSWRDLVAAAARAEREILPHRRYPMAQVRRDRGGAPLFETALNFVHFRPYESIRDLPGIEVVDRWAFEETEVPFFVLAEGGERLRLALTCHAGRMSREQAEILGSLYRRVIAAMASGDDGLPAGSLLTENERQALGHLESGAPASSPRSSVRPAFVPPRTAVERELCQLWEEELGVERVGLEDSFYGLGRDSLHALRLVACLRRRFGLPLPLATLLEAPTAQTLAWQIEAELGGRHMPAE